MSILKKIQSLFNEQNPTPQAEIGFVDVKSQDGSLILRIHGPFEIGSKVEVINADGSLSSPEDGAIILEDGNSITVTAGLISEIATKEEEAGDAANGEEAPVENMEAEVVETPEAIIETPEVVEFNAEEKYSALELRVNELFEALNTLTKVNESIEAVNTELKAKNEELSKIASSAPAAPAAEFRKFEKPETQTKKSGSMLDRVLNKK